MIINNLLDDDPNEEAMHHPQVQPQNNLHTFQPVSDAEKTSIRNQVNYGSMMPQNRFQQLNIFVPAQTSSISNAALPNINNCFDLPYDMLQNYQTGNLQNQSIKMDQFEEQQKTFIYKFKEQKCQYSPELLSQNSFQTPQFHPSLPHNPSFSGTQANEIYKQHANADLQPMAFADISKNTSNMHRIQSNQSQLMPQRSKHEQDIQHESIFQSSQLHHEHRDDQNNFENNKRDMINSNGSSNMGKGFSHKYNQIFINGYHLKQTQPQFQYQSNLNHHGLQNAHFNSNSQMIDQIGSSAQDNMNSAQMDAYNSRLKSIEDMFCEQELINENEQLRKSLVWPTLDELDFIAQLGDNDLANLSYEFKENNLNILTDLNDTRSFLKQFEKQNISDQNIIMKNISIECGQLLGSEQQVQQIQNQEKHHIIIQIKTKTLQNQQSIFSNNSNYPDPTMNSFQNEQASPLGGNKQQNEKESEQINQDTEQSNREVQQEIQSEERVYASQIAKASPSVPSITSIKKENEQNGSFPQQFQDMTMLYLKQRLQSQIIANAQNRSIPHLANRDQVIINQAHQQNQIQGSLTQSSTGDQKNDIGSPMKKQDFNSPQMNIQMMQNQQSQYQYQNQMAMKPEYLYSQNNKIQNSQSSQYLAARQLTSYEMNLNSEIAQYQSEKSQLNNINQISSCDYNQTQQILKQNQQLNNQKQQFKHQSKEIQNTQKQFEGYNFKKQQQRQHQKYDSYRNEQDQQTQKAHMQHRQQNYTNYDDSNQQYNCSYQHENDSTANNRFKSNRAPPYSSHRQVFISNDPSIQSQSQGQQNQEQIVQKQHNYGRHHQSEEYGQQQYQKTYQYFDQMQQNSQYLNQHQLVNSQKLDALQEIQMVISQNNISYPQQGFKNKQFNFKRKGKKYKNEFNPQPYNNLTLDVVQDMAFECSIDQKCSIFIQERLKQPIEWREQERFFDKLLKNDRYDFDRLIMDQNGNYIVQKIQVNTTCNQEYHELLYNHLAGKIYQFSIHRHGCRVIQTAMEVFSTSIRERMIDELNERFQVFKCSYDFNGNHVIQKIFCEMGQLQNSQSVTDFIAQIDKNVIDFCKHEYSCRVVQRMLEHSLPVMVEGTIDKILKNYTSLIKDQFGTFVLCVILEIAQSHQKEIILDKVLANYAQMSIDRDGSKLLENCIKMIGQHKFHEYQDKLKTIHSALINIEVEQNEENDGLSFSDILTNSYGNYVIQTVFEKSNSEERHLILQKIKTALFDVQLLTQSPLRHIIKFLQNKHKIAYQNILEIELEKKESSSNKGQVNSKDGQNHEEEQDIKQRQNR